MQTVLTVMVGALCWFIQRSIKKFDDGIAKLDDRITAVETKSHEKIEKLKDDFQSFQRDLPFGYVTREDYLLTMNRIEDKLNRILYGRNGGNANE